MNENLCDVLDSNELTLNWRNDVTFNETETLHLDNYRFVRIAR